MQAVLHGGPYDGICLDHNDVTLYTRFHPVGMRKFILMPPIAVWEEVRRGDRDKNGPFEGECALYELVRTPEGMAGRYDSDGGTLALALKESREGRQPVPQVEFKGQCFKCYRGDMRDVELPPNNFPVVDEKERQWTCVVVSKEEGESGGFGEMLSYLGGEPLDEPLRVAIHYCADKAELRFKLSDEID
jgi:hypothetical protein